MSTAQIQDVLDEAMSDRQFADRLRADPDAVLEEYDLPEAEAEALRTGDEDALREILGVFQADWTVSIVVVVT